MSKSDPIEKALDRIAEIRHQEPSVASADEIRRFLTHRSNLVVGKAAKLVSELQRSEMIPDLVSAYQRFMSNPVQTDKRCAAVTEIVTALYEMDYGEPEIYLKGIGHVQMEASFGPPIDAAAQLRGICARALLRTRHNDGMVAVLPLLVDPEPPARVGAVRALATNGGAPGALLLRLKALTGDPEPEVIAECFSGLLSATPEESLKFVAEFMDSDDEPVSAAAIWAVGQSRLPRAFELLKEKWERTIAREQRRNIVAAMAISRLDTAIQFLCSVIEAENSTAATDALRALGSFKSSSIKDAVATAVRKRCDPNLETEFRQEFPE